MASKKYADNPVNKQIRILIASDNLKINELAEKAGIKPLILYRIVSGERLIHIHELMALAGAMGKHYTELIGETEEAANG